MNTRLLRKVAKHIIEPEAISGPLVLIEKAVTLGMGADAIAKLWEIQKEIEDRNSRQEFMRAMNLFKQNPPELNKNKHVNYTTKSGHTVDYWHATLDHVCELVIPALAAVGISHRWETSQADKGVITVSCLLTHHLGHTERTTLMGLPDDSGGKNAIQAVGSTVYYLQRYTLLAAVGLATEGDDDARGGTKMPDFAGRVAEIYGAQDHRSLTTIFQTHFNAAKEAGDEKAMFKFIEAKDERKAQLGK